MFSLNENESGHDPPPDVDEAGNPVDDDTIDDHYDDDGKDSEEEEEDIGRDSNIAAQPDVQGHVYGPDSGWPFYTPHGSGS